MTSEEAITLAEEQIAEYARTSRNLTLSMIRRVSCVLRSDALRHLIAEARRVEKVRAKYATLEHQESVECPDAGELWAEGFEEAWEDVMLIIDGDPYPETGAPDAETKEVSRG